jgi:hypothetical protein
MLSCGMVKEKSKSADVNVLASQLVAEVTQETLPKSKKKNPAAVALDRLGGLKGGKARAKKLSTKDSLWGGLRSIPILGVLGCRGESFQRKEPHTVPDERKGEDRRVQEIRLLPTLFGCQETGARRFAQAHG